jgi:tetratricopeptide (TPR) repeat protein
MIAKLTEKGFYENAVFGDFDKADVAATYLEFLIGEIRDGRINSAISLIRRAMRLYPPFKDDCFESLYELYTEFPKEFKIYFYKNPDAFDYLGLSIKFSEKNDFNDSRYYFKEALKLKPDILETGIKSHDRYLNKGIAKVADFLNKN